MEQKYTLDEFADMMKTNKWHLIQIENEIQNTSYGTVDIKLEVRGGVVERIYTYNGRSYLKPKEGHDRNQIPDIDIANTLFNPQS